MVIRLDENYNAMTSTALLGYIGETNARPVSVEGLTVDGADVGNAGDSRQGYSGRPCRTGHHRPQSR